jgi:hypothetical protein
VGERESYEEPGQPGQPEEPLGSAAEEAMRLLGAFAAHAADVASQVGRGLDEHLATGAAECTYCPICRAVHIAREASPEVGVHLASAASSLMQAAASVLSAVASSGSDRGAEGRRTDSVQTIDLDDAWPEPGAAGHATEPEGEA